jgi:hypothetical protein
MTLVNEDRFFRTGVARLFTGSAREFINEVLQNAQRSLSTHIWISFPTPATCVIQDDGHGLVDGPESLKKVLVFSASGFANPQVEKDQRPLGMGLYSVIANEQVERIIIESYVASRSKTLAFDLDTKRWLTDDRYRGSWRRRVRLRGAQEGDHGFRLTIIGTESLINDIRACLLDTAAIRIQQNLGGMDAEWLQNKMSPACGYEDLLEVFVDGEPLDLRLPNDITRKNMQVRGTYQGNDVFLSLYPSPVTWRSGHMRWPGLLCNFFGQVVSHPKNDGWHAYLHVRAGHPVNPKAPTRAGLIEDDALRQFYAWAEDTLFTWVCAQPSPPIDYVERLYEINLDRANRECPFAVVRPWKPLPSDYVFDSYTNYVAMSNPAGDLSGQHEESDRLGLKQLVRKEDLPTLLFLAGHVVCHLPGDHPAQPWEDAWDSYYEDEDGKTSEAIFEIGMNSLLRATGLEAYRAVCGVPLKMTKTLHWRPGKMIDRYYTLKPGDWGIKPTCGQEGLPEIVWHPLSLDTGPVFVAERDNSDDISWVCWIIALAQKEDLIPFLQQCGHAAFDPESGNEDECADVYAASVDRLIRKYLGNHIARDTTLIGLRETLQPFLPDGYSLQGADLRLIYKEGTLTSLRLTFADETTKEVQFY